MIPEAPPMPPTGEALILRRSQDKKVDKLNIEFHRHFRNIPESEEILVSRAIKGSISRPNIIDGKFWISEHHICFKANWPNWSICTIPFANIINIGQIRIDFVFKETIEIETEIEKVFIGNISNSPEFYEKITTLWNNHVPPQSLFRKFPDLSNLKCACSNPGLANCDFCIKSQRVQRDRVDGNQPKPFSKEVKNAVFQHPTGIVSSPDLVRSYKEKAPPLIISSTMLTVPRSGKSQKSNLRRSPSLPAFTSEEDSSKIVLKVPEPGSKESLNTLVETTPTIKCNCGDDEEYALLHESIMPTDIPTLWKIWHCLTSDGTIFLEYLYEVQKITKLKFSPWSHPNDPSGGLENVKPIEEISGDAFAPPFEKIVPGMYRYSERALPLHHSIPFIPKTAIGTDKFKVLHVDGNNLLCIENNAKLNSLGLDTHLKFSLNRISDDETKLFVYGYARATGKGKVNPPKGIMERSTVEGVKQYYAQFANYLAENYVKQDKGEVCNCDTLVENGYSTIIDTKIASKISKAWDEIFHLKSKDGIVHFITKEAKWQGLKLSSWSGDQSKLLALEDYEKQGFELSFDEIKKGFSKKIEFDLVLNNNNQFPADVQKLTGKYTVKELSKSSICVHHISDIATMGIQNNIRICLKQRGQMLEVKVFLKVSYQAGDHQFPKDLALKTVSTIMSAKYTTIFEAMRTSKETPKVEPLNKIDYWRNRLANLTKSIPADRQLILLVTLCCVLIINTLTLLLMVRILHGMQKVLLLMNAK